jgi:hypothetical protein
MLPAGYDSLPLGAPHHFAGATQPIALMMLGKASLDDPFGPFISHS